MERMNGRKTNNLRSCRRPYLQQGNRDLHGRSLRDGRRRLYRACAWGSGPRQRHGTDRQRDRPVPRTTLSFIQRKRQPDSENDDGGDESARDRTDGKGSCLKPFPIELNQCRYREEIGRSMPLSNLLYQPSQILTRHARARRGHPRLVERVKSKTWMAGTSPAMTKWVGHAQSQLVLL